MKGASVYHQIKSLSKEYSLRDCAEKLGISVNTVRKYAGMELQEASAYLERVKRGSQYDVAREFILEYLERFPEIKATKLLRKVKGKYPRISGQVRGFRKYIAPLRGAVQSGEFRHYAPVLDMQPGVQVQVDIGEEQVCRLAPSGSAPSPEGLAGLPAGDLAAACIGQAGKTPKGQAGSEHFKTYFISFVFSYSRKGFVTFRGRCYDTESFIAAHLEAFAFFGGIAEEYVYDQTKLVVIEERYREVFFNERFHQFALKYGFRIRVCEGYDPQSKGKVERFIGYVKQDFLYGDYFADTASLNAASKVWLDEVANVRIHSITGRRPAEMFIEEQSLLRPFENPETLLSTRLVDKTGLISYKSNKYSVPYAYQRCQVEVREKEGKLIIYEPDQDKEIARHVLVRGQGNILKNNNHYRDYRTSIEELSRQALAIFESSVHGEEVIERIKTDNPAIARDQLRGLMKLGKQFEKEIWETAIETILNLPVLRVTVIESILILYRDRHKAARIDASLHEVALKETSALDRDIQIYMEVINHA